MLAGTKLPSGAGLPAALPGPISDARLNLPLAALNLKN